MGKKNMRRVSLLVTAQTAWNLDHLSKICACSQGRIVDKLIREKMISMKEDTRIGKRG